MRYIILKKNYIIHTLSVMIHYLCFRNYQKITLILLFFEDYQE